MRVNYFKEFQGQPSTVRFGRRGIRRPQQFAAIGSVPNGRPTIAHHWTRRTRNTAPRRHQITQEDSIRLQLPGTVLYILYAFLLLAE